MRVQEQGGITVGASGGSDPIPTGIATGEGEGARVKRRLPLPRNQLRRIQLDQVGLAKFKSRKQRNVVAVKVALKSGRRLVYLNTGRTKGIFRVRGGKKNPKIKMLYDLSSKTHNIQPNPWLAPATQRATAETTRFYNKRLLKQLKFAAKV
jgi:hypothetical protein